MALARMEPVREAQGLRDQGQRTGEHCRVVGSLSEVEAGVIEALAGEVSGEHKDALKELLRSRK